MVQAAEKDSFLSQLDEIEAETQPKERAPKGRGAAKSVKVADLKKTISALVSGVNQAVINFTIYGQLALEPDEEKALSDALVSEVQASKTLTNALGKASKVTPHMELVKVLSMISLTRWVAYQKIKAGEPVAPPTPIFTTDNINPQPVSQNIPTEDVPLWQA
jgi:hypothetical protein